jgi:hypothetical protein
MNAKLFLKSFWQVISIAKIFTLQALSLFFLSYSCGLLAEYAGVRGCPPRPDSTVFFLFLSLFISLGLGFLSVHPIVFPRVWLEEISKEITRSRVGFRFSFFSTHPGYILLDALLLIPAFLLYWNGQSESLCEFNHQWGQGTAALVIALTFPALRLIFWFVLGKQIYAMQAKNVWFGIIWWYILTLPVIIFFSYTYVQSTILPKRNVPLVSAETFKGGLEANPNLTDKIVKVRGKIKQGIAKCGLWGKKDREDYPFGTVVLEMGEGNGEIMVQAQKPSQVLNLEADFKSGKTFEAYGRLNKFPKPGEKKGLCGVEKLSDELPTGGRALLEIEMPK